MSGSTIKLCGCVRDGRLVPPGALVERPIGRNRHPRCYSRALAGCSSKLSLEHFISHSVQRIIAGPSGMVLVGDGKSRRRVPASTFGSRVLCGVHNNSLRQLDNVGARFFDALHGMKAATGRLRGGDEPVLNAVNGHDVERWLLKLLIGAAAGFMAETKKQWGPPLLWVRVLYGLQRMPRNCGLSFRPSNEKQSDWNSISIAPLWPTKGGPFELSGLSVVLAGYEFCLLMKPEAHRAGVYRPGAFRMTSSTSGGQSVLIVGWENPHPLMTVDLEWVPNEAREGETPGVGRGPA